MNVAALDWSSARGARPIITRSIGREATDVEFEVVGTWSEHCVHKVVRGENRVETGLGLETDDASPVPSRLSHL